MPCFYAPELTKETDKIKIYDSEFHHMTRVFRNKVGDKVNLNSGNGIYAEAEICDLTKKYVECKINKLINKERYQPRIAVAFSLLRNKNDNIIVEKLTELGVSEFYPFISEYTVRKESKNTIEKFNVTSIEAIKQCDNGFLPKINSCEKLEKQLKIIEDRGYYPVIASEIEKEKTLHEIIAQTHEKPICLLIGPEGGFSEVEFSLFTDHDYPQYKLGLNILRAETAAICAVSQLILCLLKQNA